MRMSEGAERQNLILRLHPYLEPQEVFRLAMARDDTEVIDQLLHGEAGVDDLMMQLQEVEDRADELEAERNQLAWDLEGLQEEVHNLKDRIQELEAQLAAKAA